MARHKTHRTDNNQADIVKALRKVGVEVHIIDEPVDLLCGYRGRWSVMDVKNLEGRGRKKTPAQDKFFECPKGPASIVTTPEEAIDFVCKVSSHR